MSERMCPKHKKKMHHGSQRDLIFDGAQMLGQIFYCPEGCWWIKITKTKEAE